jgi:hypothetical protein
MDDGLAAQTVQSLIQFKNKNDPMLAKKSIAALLFVFIVKGSSVFAQKLISPGNGTSKASHLSLANSPATALPN